MSEYITTPSGSEYSNDLGASDDDLMVSFPKRPRQRTFPHLPSVLHESELVSFPLKSRQRTFPYRPSVVKEESGSSGPSKSVAFAVDYDDISRRSTSGSESSNNSAMSRSSSYREKSGGDDYCTNSINHESVSSSGSKNGTSLHVTSGEDAKSSLTSSVTSEESSALRQGCGGSENTSKGSVIIKQIDEESSTQDIVEPEKEVFYSWGEMSHSDSCYSIDGSSHASDNNLPKQMSLETDFPDRQRFLNCNASFSESNVSESSTQEEPLAQDEYDPRRPWRKAPVIEVQSVSGKSDASALSSQTEGTIFIGGKICVDDNDKAVETNELTDTDSKTDTRPKLQDSKSEEGKSARSWKSSELSELRIANEALRRSGSVLAGTERPPILRQMSVLSESNFTLTTQIYRKPEPFRPGPLSSKASVCSLDKLYSGNRQDSLLFSATPTSVSGQVPSSMTKSSSFQSLGSLIENKGNSFSTLPSIVENTEKPEQKKLSRRKSLVTFAEPEEREKEIFLPQRKLDRNSSVISAITFASLNDSNARFTREELKRLVSESTLSEATQSGNEDSKRSLSSSEENSRILRASLALGGVTDLDQDKKLKDTMIASNLSKNDIQELRNTMDTTADLRESNVIDLQQVTQCDDNSFVGENNSSSTLFRDDCSRYSMDSNLNGTYSLAESSDEEDDNRNASFRERRNSRSGMTASIMTSRAIVRCRSCLCMRRRAVIVTSITIIIIATGMSLFFFYIIPTANQIRSDRSKTADSDPDNQDGLLIHPSPSPSFILNFSLEALHTGPPSPAPTVHTTFWPTPVDTYTKKYPPPGS